MLCAIFFVMYREDENMLRLQPKLKRHIGVLSPHLVTVARLVVSRQTAELPAKGQGVGASTPVLQPLPQPPLRHFKSLQVAPEAQLAALLLVDVLTATNVAAMDAPHDQQQEEGASYVQQTNFGLTFEDTLNNAYT